MTRIAFTDETVLGIVEGQVLAPRLVDQLVALLNTSGDDVVALTRDRERLAEEIKRLVDSVARGVPAESVASAIREREHALRSLDARLRAPKEARNVERLRAALEQRTAEWKAGVRDEPRVARLMLRRLVEPITLWQGADQDRPTFVRWSTSTKASSLLAGLDDAPSIWLASPTGVVPEWTREVPGEVPAASGFGTAA